MIYRITNAEGRRGRAWSDTYDTEGDAAEAIREAMGWDAVILSGSFDDNQGTAWCAYETAEACEADERGAYAPRVVRHDAQRDASAGGV